MTERRCDRCEWFVYSERTFNIGECHIKPPVTRIMKSGPCISEFPRVKEDSWCGEYKEKARPEHDGTIYERYTGVEKE